MTDSLILAVEPGCRLAADHIEALLAGFRLPVHIGMRRLGGAGYRIVIPCLISAEIMAALARLTGDRLAVIRRTGFTIVSCID